MLAQMALGMYYTVPIIGIFYFLTTQHQVAVTYYMFIYYFTGNLTFALILYLTLMTWVDRPIYAWINLKADIQEADESYDYKIENYLNFFKSGEYNSDIDE